MKLSRKPCRIVGVRVGEMTLNLLDLAHPIVVSKFVLLRGEGQAVGSFTSSAWSEKTIEAFHKFVDAVETDALRELFGEDGEDVATTPPTNLSFPSVPLLGGPKRDDTP